MSKILGDEVKEVVYSKKVDLLGIECDACGKTLPLPAKYFKVLTGHHDWGVDSCESRKYRDVCPECIDKFVSEYLKECSDTGYIEIGKERDYSKLVSADVNDRDW